MFIFTILYHFLIISLFHLQALSFSTTGASSRDGVPLHPGCVAMTVCRLTFSAEFPEILLITIILTLEIGRKKAHVHSISQASIPYFIFRSLLYLVPYVIIHGYMLQYTHTIFVTGDEKSDK